MSNVVAQNCPSHLSTYEVYLVNNDIHIEGYGRDRCE